MGRKQAREQARAAAQEQSQKQEQGAQVVAQNTTNTADSGIQIDGVDAALKAAYELVAANPAMLATLQKGTKAKTPRAPAKPKELRPICTGTKKNGEPCTSRCVAGKTVCVDHQPAWDRLTHEEHVAFGEWLRAARGPEIVEVIGWWAAKQIAKDRMRNGEPAAAPGVEQALNS